MPSEACPVDDGQHKFKDFLRSSLVRLEQDLILAHADALHASSFAPLDASAIELIVPKERREADNHLPQSVWRNRRIQDGLRTIDQHDTPIVRDALADREAHVCYQQSSMRSKLVDVFGKSSHAAPSDQAEAGEKQGTLNVTNLAGTRRGARSGAQGGRTEGTPMLQPCEAEDCFQEQHSCEGASSLSAASHDHLDMLLRRYSCLLDLALSKFLEEQGALIDKLLLQQQDLIILLQKNVGICYRSRSESHKSQSEGIVSHGTEPDTEMAILGVNNQPALQAVEQSPDKNIMTRSSGNYTAPHVGKKTNEMAYERIGALADDFDARFWYDAMWEYQHKGEKSKSVCATLLIACGFDCLLPDHAPDTCAAKLAEHSLFTMLQSLLILSNTFLMAYEADLRVKASLETPKGSVPHWLDVASMSFNIVFAIELVFRIFALRLWFCLAPGDWKWNIFDCVLVISSISLDALTGGAGFGFLRTFRLLRLVRVARIMRVVRFFHPLREMLFSILACFVSLAWSFVFMGILMFLFSLMCLQGATQVLDLMHEGSLTEDAQLRGELELYFGSMSGTMLSLLGSVTGGSDWLDVYNPLTYAGSVYTVVFVCYVLFITFGVMNVLTGVFLANTESFVDLDLIVQSQERKTEKFVEQVIDIFSKMGGGSGILTFQAFTRALNLKTTIAFLQHLGLDTSHAHLIFDLLDKDGDNNVEIHEFVTGLVRLKGNSKAIESRVILRELAMIPKLLRELKSSD